MGFENIMVFSNWGIFDIIRENAIYFFVHFLHLAYSKVGDFRSLVLGAFRLYAVTYPLTAKSMLVNAKNASLAAKNERFARKI
jgi:hypothetical protein